MQPELVLRKKKTKTKKKVDKSTPVVDDPSPTSPLAPPTALVENLFSAPTTHFLLNPLCFSVYVPPIGHSLHSDFQYKSWPAVTLDAPEHFGRRGNQAIDLSMAVSEKDGKKNEKHPLPSLALLLFFILHYRRLWSAKAGRHRLIAPYYRSRCQGAQLVEEAMAADPSPVGARCRRRCRCRSAKVALLTRGN